MPGLIISNIKKRPTRTVVSILAVSMGVVMILIFVGLTQGMLKDSTYRTQNIKADLLFQPPGSSLLLALNNATMPIRIKDKLMQVEGIQYVSPMLHQFSKKSFSLIFGIDPVSFNQVSGDGIIIMKGRLFQAPHECIVDDIYQKSHQISLGQVLTILNRRSPSPVSSKRGSPPASSCRWKLSRSSTIPSAKCPFFTSNAPNRR